MIINISTLTDMVIMGYEEDGGWDDAELFVFDVKNRIDWNPEDN